VSDAKNIHRFLTGKRNDKFSLSPLTISWPSTGRLGFRSRDVIRLTDEARDPRNLPTRQNILGAIRWLVRGAHKHDSLFFHCTFVPGGNSYLLTPLIVSGHGSQIRDLNGDDADQYDEGNANESSSVSIRPDEWQSSFHWTIPIRGQLSMM